VDGRFRPSGSWRGQRSWVGACFPDAGPGSNATTSVRRNAVKPTGRLSRAAADVARETFRSTFSPTCAEKSTGTSKSSPQRVSEDFPLAGAASVGSADSHRSGNGDRAGLKGYRGAAARLRYVVYRKHAFFAPGSGLSGSIGSREGFGRDGRDARRFRGPECGWPLPLPITVPNPAHAQFLGRAAADPLEETRALSVQQQPPDELFRVLKKVNATRLPALF
jgi:hypothetical protein